MQDLPFFTVDSDRRRTIDKKKGDLEDARAVHVKLIFRNEIPTVHCR
jgi:hypothetical protein